MAGVTDLPFTPSVLPPPLPMVWPGVGCGHTTDQNNNAPLIRQSNYLCLLHSPAAPCLEVPNGSDLFSKCAPPSAFA